MSRLPTLVALRCLDASERHRSFTRAAQELHLTQGAVSHQILALEAQLGATLFVRQRSGLQLTPAGEAYCHDVRAVLRQLERATQDVMTHRGRGGVLNVCVASSFATYWLMPRLRDFVALHPEVTLNLSTHIGPVNFAASAHDAAIEYCSGAQPGLRAERVMPLVLRPHAAPELLGRRSTKRPMPKAALLRCLQERPLLRHTTVPTAWPHWLRINDLAGKLPDDHLQAGPRYDLLSMALNGAIAGIGIALLPDYVAAEAVAQGRLVRLSDAAWTSEHAYYLRYPDARATLPSLGCFVAWLRNQSAPEPANASLTATPARIELDRTRLRRDGIA